MAKPRKQIPSGHTFKININNPLGAPKQYIEIMGSVNSTEDEVGDMIREEYGIPFWIGVNINGWGGEDLSAELVTIYEDINGPVDNDGNEFGEDLLYINYWKEKMEREREGREEKAGRRETTGRKKQTKKKKASKKKAKKKKASKKKAKKKKASKKKAKKKKAKKKKATVKG
jgi:hypothetical protein